MEDFLCGEAQLMMPDFENNDVSTTKGKSLHLKKRPMVICTAD
jgi:hypothetical protein